MLIPKMPDALRVELRFRGAAVDDGAMPVDDMINTLIRFAGAYRTIAGRYHPDASERSIRVVGLQRGSAQILIDITDWVAKNPGAAEAYVTAAGLFGAGAYKVLNDLAAVIEAKKTSRGQIVINNTFAVQNSGMIVGDVVLTPEQAASARSPELGFDVDKMTAPLDPDRGVDQFEMKAGSEELVRVSKEDRRYLKLRAEAFLGLKARTQARKASEEIVSLEGTFISNSKQN